MIPDSTTQNDAVWAVISSLPDPEIPVLTLSDLGIIRWVKSSGNETVVGVAPTYSGCPATEVIEASVIDALVNEGYANVRVQRGILRDNPPPFFNEFCTPGLGNIFG